MQKYSDYDIILTSAYVEVCHRILILTAWIVTSTGPRTEYVKKNFADPHDSMLLEIKNSYMGYS